MPIITPISQNQTKKHATDRDLEKITHPQTITAHRLTPLERRWFGFFVALGKIGHVGIAASVGKLTDEEYRVNGQTHSERTTYRALRGLEEKQIITRRTFRVGDDKFRCVILFNMSAFSFYLQTRTKNVAPLPTSVYISSPLPGWQEEKLTSNPVVLPSKGRSLPAYLQNEYQKKIARYLIPVLITLRVILTGRARFIGLRRAEYELASGDYVSGVDWPYWARRWPEFDFVRRDATALNEIIPAILAPDYGGKPPNGDCAALIEAFCAEKPPDSPNPPQRGAVEKPNCRPPPPSPGSDLANDDLKVLLQARERARERRAAGWT